MLVGGQVVLWVLQGAIRWSGGAGCYIVGAYVVLQVVIEGGGGFASGQVVVVFGGRC